MPNGGIDNCARCWLNNIGEISDREQMTDSPVYCTLRSLPIDDPIHTYCGNHQDWNPLQSRKLYGPIWINSWIPVEQEPSKIDNEALAKFLMNPFMPVIGHGRIPYFGSIRPFEANDGKCKVCGSQKSIAIKLTIENINYSFCCTTHYLEWWSMNAPEAKYMLAKESDLRKAVKEIQNWCIKLLSGSSHNEYTYFRRNVLSALDGFDEILRLLKFQEIYITPKTEYLSHQSKDQVLEWKARFSVEIKEVYYAMIDGNTRDSEIRKLVDKLLLRISELNL